MKRIIASVILLSSLTCFARTDQIPQVFTKDDITITVNASTKEIPEVKGTLTITNNTSKKQFVMKQRDFLILKRGYENWRSVSEYPPVITTIDEDDNYIYIDFSYYDKNNGKSEVLSGTVIVGKRYLYKNNYDKYYIGAISGLSIYSILVTILILL